VSIVILLVLLAVIWLVVLAPSAWRRISERRGVGSVDHFHHQLELLEQAGPKLVAPAYRLRGTRSGIDGNDAHRSSHSTSSPPTLVLLRAVGDRESADIAGDDGAQYERVGVIERPQPVVSPAPTQAGLAAYRRQQARRRCTLLLRILTATAITTGVLGVLPSLRLAWIFTAVSGIAALALVGLIAHARELEAQRRRRPRVQVHHAAEHDPFAGSGRTGHPGGWDEEDDLPQRHAAGSG
jgi:hypothetical protein